MSSSPSPSDAQLIPHPGSPDSQISPLIHDLLSQQFEAAAKKMLEMTNQIEQKAAEIYAAIAKTKEEAIKRKEMLEEKREYIMNGLRTMVDMLESPLDN